MSHEQEPYVPASLEASLRHRVRMELRTASNDLAALLGRPGPVDGPTLRDHTRRVTDLASELDHLTAQQAQLR